MYIKKRFEKFNLDMDLHKLFQAWEDRGSMVGYDERAQWDMLHLNVYEQCKQFRED